MSVKYDVFIKFRMKSPTLINKHVVYNATYLSFILFECHILVIHFISCNATINHLNEVVKSDHVLCSNLLHSHTITFNGAPLIGSVLVPAPPPTFVLKIY